MSSPTNVTGQNTKTTILWDTEPVKKSIQKGTDLVVDALKPVALVGTVAVGESLKLTPVGAVIAPAIDISTKVVAPISIPASMDASKPVLHSSTDLSVDSSHTTSVKVVNVFKKNDKQVKK